MAEDVPIVRTMNALGTVQAVSIVRYKEDHRMSRIVNAWDQARLEYQKRYVYYFRKHKEQQNNQDVLGHLHECSYVLIHVFGLSAGQVTELERNNFCGLANADIERKYPEEGYEP